MTNGTAIWQGASGRTYAYDVFALNTDWNDLPGNYIFAKVIGGIWSTIYIGQTDSFKNRLPNHETWERAKRNGVTHVHAHVNHAGESARRSEEIDLITRHKPPCNTHGV